MRPTTLLFITATVLSAPTYAVTDQERSVLHRLYTEMTSLSALVLDAQQGSNPADKEQIDYGALKNDLQTVQQGLLHAIKAERREPRSLAPINGDYR